MTPEQLVPLFAEELANINKTRPDQDLKTAMCNAVDAALHAVMRQHMVSTNGEGFIFGEYMDGIENSIMCILVGFRLNVIKRGLHQDPQKTMIAMGMLSIARAAKMSPNNYTIGGYIGPDGKTIETT